MDGRRRLDSVGDRVAHELNQGTLHDAKDVRVEADIAALAFKGDALR